MKQPDLQLDEPFRFAAEVPEQPMLKVATPRWRCLILDDDDGVHQTIAFSMHKLLIEGREIEWLHAYSAAQACALLEKDRDVCVILLDVVMEHEKSGLEMVHTIRTALGMHTTRIILHTGQPGFAPEIAAIRDYDINDYRTKSELTRNHIYTCLASAIRTYRQICRMEAGRQQLRSIIQAGNSLMSEPDEAAFASSALVQLADLFGVGPKGCAVLNNAGGETGEVRVVTTCGQCPQCQQSDVFGRPLCQGGLPGSAVQWCADGVVVVIEARSGLRLALHLKLDIDFQELVDHSVIETFVAHVAACLDNHSLLGRLQHDAFYDRQLGLPNRRRLGDLLDACYAASLHRDYILGLIDIDRFGEINEALGQGFGDALLEALVDRLRTSVSVEVALARVSADVFAVFGQQELIRPEALLQLFATPLLVQGEETMVSITIGMTRLLDVEPGSGATAMEASFQALRTAKAMQRGQVAWYSPEQSQRTHERVNLLNGLRLALRQGGLSVVFQPQVRMCDRSLVGLEALVRWRTETGVLLGPERFIQIAEQSGLIREIGFFVLRQACDVLASLPSTTAEPLRMAVNVSAIQFRHPAFLSVLRQIISDSGIDPAQLELEITESVAMEDAPYVRETLDALHGMGIQLAIDDFGTGYSSLSQLKQLAVDRLKIDKAFVHDLREPDVEASIAGVVIQLGRRLGKAVIAEGVETETQARLLRQLGCQEGQGYLFAVPMSLEALREWLNPVTRSQGQVAAGGFYGL